MIAKEPSRHEVWRMFDRVANRYDFLNHFLSFNRDKAWRRKLADSLPDGNELTVLDLATGTADQLLALYDTGRVRNGVGVDMAEQMLAIGQIKIDRRRLSESLKLLRADAERLPFGNGCFDVVSITFGIRNVLDVSLALREMHRVLHTGGRVLILEFSLPHNVLLRKLYLFYFRRILPRLGGLISGDAYAYHYLNETVETFPYGDSFRSLMGGAGFINVKETPLTFGVATLYQGDKA
ncbi:MAG: bifunctional demethylmenaquinone methyltransferase/2-methoxy-6-polyprenyl-1,4-benzoquinol methylase UbiE [Candidatus Zixiibacteriota bacterium]